MTRTEFEQRVNPELLQVISIGIELLIAVVIIVGIIVILRKKAVVQRVEVPTPTDPTDNNWKPTVIVAKEEVVVSESTKTFAKAEEPINDDSKEESIEEPVEQLVEEVEESTDIETSEENEDEIEEQTEDDEDEEQATEIETNNTAVQVKAFGTGKSKNFAIRLKESDKKTKENYRQIDHELLSYYRVRERLSKPCESYHVGRKTLCKLVLRGKTLRVYLALDPQKFEVSKYNHVDVSDKSAYQATPMLMRVRSPRSLKRTLRLIEQMMNENGIEKFN
jgi:hypothetical protein